MTEPAAPGRNRALWRRFTRHRGAAAGAAVFLGIVAAVWLGPFLWRVDRPRSTSWPATADPNRPTRWAPINWGATCWPGFWRAGAYR